MDVSASARAQLRGQVEWEGMGMVERIARSLAEPNLARWQDYTADAIRVLRAIRQPTAAMLSADPAQDGDWTSERDLFWKGMIDAELGA